MPKRRTKWEQRIYWAVEHPGIARTRENLLRKEGDYWTISYEGRAFRLKDTKGLRYLAELLRNPGREFHVLDLVAADHEPGETPSTAVSFDLGDAGQLLDAPAKTA